MSERWRGSFSLPLMQWLCRQFGSRVELAWRNGSISESFDEQLAMLIQPAEQDGFDDLGLSTQRWCQRAAGPRRTTLQWLLDRIAQTGLPVAWQERYFDQLDVEVRATLNPEDHQRLRFPSRPDRRRVLDAARWALARRGRETDPVTYAVPAGVEWLPLVENLNIALFHLPPARRRAFDSYIGFVVAHDGEAIAYGGGWLFFHRATLGINIFPEFRGRDSAGLFEAIVKLYQARSGASEILIEPYQFGRDNEEAIASGAFWFYYKLGFRPVVAELAALAESERSKKLVDPAYRTSRRRLRRLAEGELRRAAAGSQPNLPELHRIAQSTTCWIAERHHGDLDAARRAARRRLRRVCGELPEAETTTMLALSLSGALERASWTAQEKKLLAALVRSKAASTEWRYVRTLQQLPKLRELWAEEVRTGTPGRHRTPKG
jgi:hypothetical protein